MDNDMVYYLARIYLNKMAIRGGLIDGIGHIFKLSQ